mmetsp:Transcript_8728/g.13511  ORF Transcript_8728/g.13511 Transcript_8728/m.13511 type:complete len:124 (+) Transcript_8728:202-573(+)
MMTGLLVVYYLMLAGLIFGATREHPKVLFYFGFLKGSFSKAFFLLFCSCLVVPMNDSLDLTSASFMNTLVGGFLMIVAILQLVKVCKKNKEEDSNHSESLMDEEAGRPHGEQSYSQPQYGGYS